MPIAISFWSGTINISSSRICSHPRPQRRPTTIRQFLFLIGSYRRHKSMHFYFTAAWRDHNQHVQSQFSVHLVNIDRINQIGTSAPVQQNMDQIHLYDAQKQSQTLRILLYCKAWPPPAMALERLWHCHLQKTNRQIQLDSGFWSVRPPIRLNRLSCEESESSTTPGTQKDSITVISDECKVSKHIRHD